MSYPQISGVSFRRLKAPRLSSGALWVLQRNRREGGRQAGSCTQMTGFGQDGYRFTAFLCTFSYSSLAGGSEVAGHLT